MAGAVIGDLGRAVADLRDPRCWGVVAKAVALTLALLAAGFVSLGLVLGFGDLTMTLPWIGPVDVSGLGLAAYVAAAMAGSVLLTPLVAALFVGLLLDDVVDAVEARSYAASGPARPVPFATQMIAGLRLLGVMIVANLLGVAVYMLAAPLAPATFLLINGYLIGREYFELVALRRATAGSGRSLRRRNRLSVTLIGAAVAALLAVPLVNLFAPLLGVAAMTHRYHKAAG